MVGLLIQDCTVLRTLNVCQTLEIAACFVTTADLVNRTASAMAAFVVSVESFSTTSCDVPARNDRVPRLAHTPPVPDAWLTFTAVLPPL